MKKLKAIFIFILILFISTACSEKDIDVSDVWGNYWMPKVYKEFTSTDHIVLFHIEKKIFRGFIKNPCTAVFGLGENTVVEFFKRSDDEEEPITIGSLPPQSVSGFKTNIREGIGWPPIYLSFIDFAGSKEALEDYLLEQGVEAKVEKTLVIFCRDVLKFSINTAIYMQTDVGNYFATVNEDPSKPRDGHSAKDFDYTLYTFDEFAEKFKLK